jgi:KipI family sensor histidine kinase inhibitor
VKLRVVGEDALMLYISDSSSEQALAQVQAAVTLVEQALGDELVDLVPSYASVLVLYDPLRSDRLDILRRMRTALRAPLTGLTAPAPGRDVVLPVYYSPESGADLQALATRAGLSTQQVIDLHAGTQYRVYAIGFAPGFAYLGQVDERIAAPRLATPRPKVPRGSVAIADRQTAVYPAESPGGWNLIGLCPVPMFVRDAQSRGAQPCMPVSVGDAVRFEPIDRERFLALGGMLA